MLLLPAIAWAAVVVVDEENSGRGKALQTAQSIAAPVAKEVWVGEDGSSLQEAIFKWVAKENARRPAGRKWKVIWDTKTNYDLKADVRFEGSLDEAVGQFIKLYEKGDKPLIVRIQPEQLVIYVTNRKP